VVGATALVRVWLKGTLQDHAPWECLGGHLFFDEEEASTTRGKQICHCPGCHDLLGLPGLRSLIRPRSDQADATIASTLSSREAVADVEVPLRDVNLPIKDTESETYMTFGKWTADLAAVPERFRARPAHPRFGPSD
jgi:hypothetical protein